LAFYVNNIDGTDPSTPATEAMRILANGNVSIGDTTATSMFNVGTANQFQVSSTGVSSAGAGSTDLNGSGVPEAHCLADGTGCPVAGGSVSLGGALSCSNLSFGTGAGTSPTCNYVDGYDSNFTVGITTGSSPSASPGDVFTITFTTTRGHNSACTMTPLIQSIYSSLAQIPWPEASGGGGGTATNIQIGSPATALAAATSYNFNINCP
jgi:hypothetical protein